MSGVLMTGTVSAPTGIKRHRRGALPGPVVGLCMILMAIVVAFTLFGWALMPYPPGTQDLQNVSAAPSAAHWLGTDVLGRDVLARLIAGTASAFVGPLVIAAGSFLIGNVLGLLAGYRGGLVDGIIMRWVDLMWSIPSLLILIVTAGAIGANYWVTVALLVILSTPLDTRVARGAALEQTPRPYVEAAKTSGISNLRIMWVHIWPNIAPITIANAFLVFAGSVGILAALSFLGLGVPPGQPDWGLSLAENQPLLFVQPIAALAPAIMIVLTATAMNLIGDWMYERLSQEGSSR